MRIREAAARDHAGIASIFREVFGRSGDSYYEVRWDNEARRCVEQYYTLVANAGREVEGFVSARFYQPRSLLFPFKVKRGEGKVSFIIDWLVVAPGFQNRGVGSSLMKKMLSQLSALSKQYSPFKNAIVLVRASNWWEFRRGRRRVIPVSRDSPAVKFYRFQVPPWLDAPNAMKPMSQCYHKRNHVLSFTQRDQLSHNAIWSSLANECMASPTAMLRSLFGST